MEGHAPNNSISENCLAAFSSAMHEIESLEEFYKRSLKTVNDYNEKVHADCSAGIRISKLFNSVLALEGIDKRNQKIEEILNEQITDDLKLKDICLIEHFSEEDKPLRYSMPENYFRDAKYSPIQARRRLSNVGKYRKILNESVISHIMVSFENFLSDIYRTLIYHDPLKYLGDQTIKFVDLIRQGETAIPSKIDQVVENDMRDSLNLLQEIIKKENICIDRYEEIIKTFSEIYFRRNAYIHTAGCVNQDYLKKVDKQLTKKLKVGDALSCEKSYLENSIITLIKVVFSITVELVQKDSDFQEPVDFIAAYFFDRLCSKEYCISRYAYRYLSQIKGVSFECRSMYLINYINACKQLGDKKTVEKELRKFDVSAMHIKFIIAKHCLADETDKVYDLLSKSYPESFDAISIREWPIFINFRETEEYNRFVDEHKSDFEVQEMPPEEIEYKSKNKENQESANSSTKEECGIDKIAIEDTKPTGVWTAVGEKQ